MHAQTLPATPNLAPTLGVILRIHWQAAKLWAKRVRYVAKPAPPAQGTTR